MTMDVPCCEIESCQHISLDNRVVRFASQRAGMVILVLCQRHERAFRRFVARDALTATRKLLAVKDEKGRSHIVPVEKLS